MRKRKWEDIAELLVIVLAIILLNLLAERYFVRIDLTEDKRYTLSEASQKVLKNLEEPVYIEVYLEGELNASFKRLQKSIQETLDEFRAKAGANIQYKFINPETVTDNPEQQSLYYQELMRKGVVPTDVFETVKGKKIQKRIFPGAIISYKNKEQSVQLLGGNKAASPQEQLNQSIENVEYNLISAIQKVSISEKPRIAFLEGFNTLNYEATADLTRAMSDLYIVERKKAEQPFDSDLDILIIAQPKARFTDKAKYYIDQYIMNGGKAIFLLDQVQMNLDSISQSTGTYAFAYDLNINDLLFRYGVRVNQDLIQDQQAGMVVLNVGQFGSSPNLQRLPFPYFPILNTFSTHPITKNMDAIYTQFISSIDTVKSTGVRKIPLVFTSNYSRKKQVPLLISLEELKKDLEPEQYTSPHLPVVYLLEGVFQSGFKGRFPPEGEDKTLFKEQSKETKVIVIADGDIIRSEKDRRNGQMLPLGYDPITQAQFSNKDFFMNTLAYLIDAQGVISARGKEIKMRPLDSFRLQKERTYWQMFNIAMPVVLLLLFAVGWNYLRRKKYRSKD
ncbi:MAG: gliding motility-associated ABC transporter substrate-binding protein GldG [Bernardetiaceae bacterium]|nr:gliding motility-associated ABC transporter substrate-binding protein GldG [Bernardetiaceae bacterium]